MKKRSLQSGLSLVEIMVALVIGLFLVVGVIQVYSANNHTFRFAEAVSRAQESGRFAIDMIAQDLRAGSFWGCAFFNPSNTGGLVNNLNTAGNGYNAVLHDFIGRGSLEGSNNDGLNDSDSLTVRGAKRRAASVKIPYNTPTSEPIHIDDTDTIDTGDIVIISNCEGADIFQVSGTGAGSTSGLMSLSHVTGGAGTPGNANVGACSGVGNAHCLSRTYGGDSIVSELQTVQYSIAAGANGQPSLWRSENGTNEELIDGVAEMQILYGVDPDNDGSVNQYLTSNAVSDMNTVNAVRVMLLIESADDGIVEAPQTYRFNGEDITATDNRLRQVFSTTIGLRNR